MRRGIYCLLFVLLIVVFSSCEEEPEDLQINDFVNQEYEAKKNRLFAATIGFEEFEASEVLVDSINNEWLLRGKNNKEELSLYLPVLKIGTFQGNDSNTVRMVYMEYGVSYYISNVENKTTQVEIQITKIDSSTNSVYGKYNGIMYGIPNMDKKFVDGGVFNNLKISD